MYSILHLHRSWIPEEHTKKAVLSSASLWILELSDSSNKGIAHTHSLTKMTEGWTIGLDFIDKEWNVS